ncbi:helicase-related protein [Exiguobacterium sp. s46]|uniref:DEAD/DEAH box helicase n=1 Tax=Exiguobacterium sp. s46 TaxID=2751200 RepID=UPI001BEAB137|nr:helicase-related protein [Exiguobacterium sp. s46]
MNFKIGVVIQDTIFPEPVRIINFTPYGDTHQLVQANGLNTNRYYQQIFSNEVLCSVKKIDNHSLNTWQDIQSLLHYHFLRSELFSSKGFVSKFDKITPYPHQIDAVYEHFLSSSPVRFLLADDPGAGKTIMSGMLLKELRNRQNIKKILILTPPLVLTQWKEELFTKFDEDFTVISRSTLNTEKINPFLTHSFCLASLNWCTRDDVQQLILEADFDLIIIDEAHKMAAYQTGKKRISKTKLYAFGEKILGKTPHALLLTATPHKGDSQNYRLLLKLLNPDVFHDQLNENMLREDSNPYIVRRLKEDMIDLYGNSVFAKRITKTIQYTLGPEELELHKKITAYVAEYYDKALSKKQNATTFALMILQRRLSSSFYALEQSLGRRVNKLSLLLSSTDRERKKITKTLSSSFQSQSEDNFILNHSEDELDGTIENYDTAGIEKELSVVHELLLETKNIRRYYSEKKFNTLEDLLFGVNGLAHENNKILIFTESVDTLNFLKKKLSLYISNIATIQGSQTMSERFKQINFFKNTAQIMIATDAGGESINLQFCNQLINYDIPWNPNKLEQRMGRIHRIGQKRDVFIFNLVSQNTREGYVLNKLFEKIDTMKEDLGEENVYDFIGELLEGDLSLTRIMEDVILSEQNLDTFVENFSNKLEVEHQELHLKSTQWNSIKPSYDLHKINDSIISGEEAKTSSSFLESFIIRSLESQHIMLEQSNDIYNIQYVPPTFKNQYPISIDWENEESFTFKSTNEITNMNVQQVNLNHSLFKWTLDYLEDQFAFLPPHKHLIISEDLERMMIWSFSVNYKNINQELLHRSTVTLCKRSEGDIVQINNKWFFDLTSPNITYSAPTNESDPTILNKIISKINIDISEYEELRKSSALKLKQYITRSFEDQFNYVYDLITQKSSSLSTKETKDLQILKSSLSSIDKLKIKKLEEIDRQSKLSIDYPELIGQFEIENNVNSSINTTRLFSIDFEEIIRDYEHENNRSLKKIFLPLGVIDFYSEHINGDGRYIRISRKATDNEKHALSLLNLNAPLYLYIVDHSNNVINEYLI